MNHTRRSRGNVLICVVVGLLTSHGLAAPTAAPDATPIVWGSVATAAQTLTESGDPLLPAGTTVDGTRWDGNVLVVELTIAASQSPWAITPTQMESIGEVLGTPWRDVPEAGGVRVLVRVAPETSYQPLDEFVPHEAVMPEPPAPQAPAGTQGLRDGRTAAAGPRTPAVGQQPIGALTGVTVFATGGHGWTAGSSAWALQRPLLNAMIEDYGNLDQLNYFVEYLYNAGATVVPFRPVGYQNTEIVLDQDDPEVTYTGAWTNSAGTPYYENNRTVSGVGYRVATAAATESATARYTPNIPSADFYPVYTWVLSGTNRTTQKYRIVHSGGTTEVIVDHRLVGKGWVWLGNYHFAAGTGGYVQISNESSAGGVVIADAIRFGNGIGDVVGAGPGTVSGYPRDEECQRYWAESETHNHAVGMSTSIYDCCTLDSDDNVGTGARWGREMNETGFNNDRWRRVYLEFHTNASSGSSRGTLGLITGSPTTNQAALAQTVAEEIENDMVALSSGFEYSWAVLASNTLTGSYGAISTTNNSNEFDATIIEVAFHDNSQDAALMLDPKVRDAVARSSMQGLIKFLHGLSGSTVPLAFPPTAPQQVQAVQDGLGGVTVSWIAPLSGEAYGDPAAGYRVYRSLDGHGFDGGLDVGNVLTTTLNDVPVDTTTYLRVAAYNAGGESPPSEVLAVRRRAGERATFLVVNGFDRVARTQDPYQTLAGVGTQRRPLIRHVNSSDYVIQQAEALAAAGATFDSCANEAVIATTVPLGNHRAVTWILGEESTLNETFSNAEQTLVASYLNGGGKLFVSGAEIGWDLDAQGSASDRSFYNNVLKADYVADDAGTYTVSAVGGSIFAGLASFAFDNGTLFYDTEYPDVISPLGGATSALSYVGGTGGTAGVVFDGAYRLVNFGFPFETITTAAGRAAVMDRIVGFFFHGPFDADRDGDVDLNDLRSFNDCLQGPGVVYSPGDPCLVHDADADLDVDLADAAGFQAAFTGN